MSVFSLLTAGVRHATYPAKLRARSAAAGLFTLLTAGGRLAAPWNAFNRVVRPHNVAMPPSTLSLEPDHLFAVGRKR